MADGLNAATKYIATHHPESSFDLVGTKAVPSGIILSTYKAAGPLKTG